MEPTPRQLAFLLDLRRGACPAGVHLDASMVGPLIRAHLVQWDDEAGGAARPRQPPGTIFALSELGAGLLAEHEARSRQIASPV